VLQISAFPAGHSVLPGSLSVFAGANIMIASVQGNESGLVVALPYQLLNLRT
jgi:hypothetical protein